jgi:ribonuclease HI
VAATRNIKKKAYAVAAGRKVGIFSEWFGPDGAEAQVRGVAHARFKGFTSYAEAENWLHEQREGAAHSTGGTGAAGGTQDRAAASDAPAPRRTRAKRSARARRAGAPVEASPGAQSGATVERADGSKSAGSVVIHTDGGAIGNPGPGGYGAVIIRGGARREISGGFRHTTNNRMELMACIVALESLDEASSVVLSSDSQYVVNGIMKGWAKRWRSARWVRVEDGTERPNADLWARLLELTERHDVTFHWVRGHAGDVENERCDELAVASAHRPGLPVDGGYAPETGARR